MRLRTANPSDAETIHRLITELAIYEREPDAVEVTVDELREQLASSAPPFECVLAERDGEPLGFALFFQTYSTWRGRPGMHLEDLFVPERHRGRGVGRALLEHLIEVARARGYGRVEWAVLDWNTDAIGFYEHLGARPHTGWTAYRLTL